MFTGSKGKSTTPYRGRLAVCRRPVATVSACSLPMFNSWIRRELGDSVDSRAGLCFFPLMLRAGGESRRRREGMRLLVPNWKLYRSDLDRSYSNHRSCDPRSRLSPVPWVQIRAVHAPSSRHSFPYFLTPAVGHAYDGHAVFSIFYSACATGSCQDRSYTCVSPRSRYRDYLDPGAKTASSPESSHLTHSLPLCHV
jgi:hypothetical protein